MRWLAALILFVCVGSASAHFFIHGSVQNPPSTAPQILSVALSNNSIAPGLPSGTVVGTLSATMSLGSFTGTWSLSTTQGGCTAGNGANNASFQIVTATLETNAVVGAGTYQVCVLATQIGASNSPFGQPFTITVSTVTTSCIPSATIVCPLTGATLMTSFSGTLGFTNKQGWYGFVLTKNGTPTNVTCIGLTKDADGVAYCKYNTLLPSPMPATACESDNLVIKTTANSGSSTTLTDNNGDTFTFGGGGTVIHNGVDTTFTAQTINKAGDGWVYVNSSGLGGGAVFYAWDTVSANFMPISFTSVPVGTFRKVYKCPAGF